jgi:DNA-binding GntR family transcriptional regulator
MVSAEPWALQPRRALADEVYEGVLGLLMDHIIKPGEHASIDGIAKQLGVSPTPVREALTRLESEGLVTKQPLRGYTASPLLDETGLRNLYEVRELIEPVAAGRAATAISAEELERLAELARLMHASATASNHGEERYQDYRDFAVFDAEFHQRVLTAAGNPLLVDAITRLHPHIHLYRLYYRFGVEEEETSAEHDAVVSALAAGDSSAAEAAMRAHLSASFARMSGHV